LQGGYFFNVRYLGRPTAKTIRAAAIAATLAGGAVLLSNIFLFPLLLSRAESLTSPDQSISPLGAELGRWIIYALAGVTLSGGIVGLLGCRSWPASSDRQATACSDTLLGTIYTFLLSVVYACLAQVDWMQGERGAIELSQAGMLLIAGWYMLKAGAGACRSLDTSAPKSIRIFFSALGLLLLLMGMEELSWGQWLFGWRTSASWSAVNVAKETNLHNLLSYEAFGPIYLAGSFGLLLIVAAALLPAVPHHWGMAVYLLPSPVWLAPAAFMFLLNLTCFLYNIFPVGNELEELMTGGLLVFYAVEKKELMGSR